MLLLRLCKALKATARQSQLPNLRRKGWAHYWENALKWWTECSAVSVFFENCMCQRSLVPIFTVAQAVIVWDDWLLKRLLFMIMCISTIIRRLVLSEQVPDVKATKEDNHVEIRWSSGFTAGLQTSVETQIQNSCQTTERIFWLWIHSCRYGSFPILDALIVVGFISVTTDWGIKRAMQSDRDNG